MSGLAGRGAAEEVKVRVSLPEALRRYGLPTSPRGRIACPIHGGEGPNFAYDQRRFHCFVCGAGGSVIDLVMGLFSLAYPQALVRLDAVPYPLSLCIRDSPCNGFDGVRPEVARCPFQ
ncbi:CHC2 zinc finger domain-containing protein [Bittarella massiliensis (ex Durand et al. 2017)]|uniref:CHC2 zinc finger domain-containing protein n=1 Tax=Bittarella massiliensis (ex Durand et al. 2017) TaxID=1720313 RepID=UPI00073E33C0|nr:CHC2 zinc finger domain-containing protein [Bittarella massiliensis (ex Durand et al. 2017)]